MIFKNSEKGLKIYVLIYKSLIDFNGAFISYNELQFLGWPSIVARSPAGLMYILYWLVILVQKNIQVSTLTIGYIKFHQDLSVSMWKKSWLKCIILIKITDV